MRKLVALFAFAAATAMACAAGSGLHGDCMSDADCSTGLSCVAIKTGSCSGVLMTLGFECNKTCKSEHDCANLTGASGGPATCTGGCPGAMQCF
jgi:hypothetical protein